jgi:hypothetical protein
MLRLKLKSAVPPNRLLLILACALAGAAHAQFVQQGGKLVAAGGGSQGWSVALSADGNTAIVGAPYDNNSAGAARVYTRSAGVWTQQGSSLIGNDAVGSAQQGISVALSADGNTAILGGPQDNGGAGAAWVFTRSGGVWTQQGSKLSANDGGGLQGCSVALSADGNTAIVGAPGGFSCAHFTCFGPGAAWVFARSAGIWTQQSAPLAGTGAIGYAGQGFSVALSGDGNTAIVGGPYDNFSTTGGIPAGAAWVFARSEGVWTEQGKLVGTGAFGGAHQGWSVSLSVDGGTALVGGPDDGDELGAAWVFTRLGGVWTQQGKLPWTGGGSLEGQSVALSGDGNTAFLGGYYYHLGGAAWVYTRSGGVWAQQGSGLVGIGAVDTGDSPYLGDSVALSADGGTAILGGPWDNEVVGAAWVFTSPRLAKIGTYNAGQWLLDVNDNGIYDGNPPDLSASFGWAGATYVTGDWNGDGHTKIGVYQNGFWYLDFIGNGLWDGGVVDQQYAFGWADPNVIPVVGDWNGDGRAKIGVYYNGFWYLDYDGNGVWDGDVNDKAYAFGWPAAGVTPIVGDWNGDGRAKIGIYYNGLWYLDYDGNGIWDGGVADKAYTFGWAATGVTPIMGDWNGDGRAKIGIYYNGLWYLDYDGNGVWNGGVNDKAYSFGASNPAATPLVGDWTGTGTAKIGIFCNGHWYLDFLGNGVWDGGVVDRLSTFGSPGDTPIVGKW